MPDRIYTIGFAKRSAEDFFETLRGAEAARVVDIRLRNTSQLAGFTKRENLPYLLRVILGMEYVHLPELGPSEELFRRYRTDWDWDSYARDLVALLAAREVERTVDLSVFEPRAVLLCTEPNAERCHRSLVAGYLRERVWPEVEVVHL